MKVKALTTFAFRKKLYKLDHEYELNQEEIEAINTVPGLITISGDSDQFDDHDDQTLSKSKLNKMKKAELLELAVELELDVNPELSKEDIITQITERQSE